MAQNFGGKYSPNGKSKDTHSKQFLNAKRTRVGGRVNLLFLVPLPLLWKAFTSEPIVMAQYLASLGTLLLGAWLTREGLLAEEAYHARKIARRPAMPRKIIGGVLTGLGLGIAGLAGFGVIDALIFVIFGTGLHLLAFGLDPLTDKGAEGIDTFQTDRVARAVEEAEKHLTAMRDAILRAGDRDLERRVAQFETTARDLFRTIEDDPRDLTSARKYLSVYLKGARDATSKFADVYARNQNSKARAGYEELLNDLEQNFAARTRTLLINDHSDLTVEIDVLRERLQREGIRDDV
ncbi:5-bromo-4-chloroindolyl phosphate hydrolysis family protein [Cognatishimia sp. WU-CL00825]|uniref:5-bromo-4-chloroindolyl phosphate hydrolysis family protein n=1 Tax=Cognatishimia sp. WU-CL00825 TaxID=3127658 RepID=UPI003103BDCA